MVIVITGFVEFVFVCIGVGRYTSQCLLLVVPSEGGKASEKEMEQYVLSSIISVNTRVLSTMGVFYMSYVTYTCALHISFLNNSLLSRKRFQITNLGAI